MGKSCHLWPIPELVSLLQSTVRAPSDWQQPGFPSHWVGFLPPLSRNSDPGTIVLFVQWMCHLCFLHCITCYQKWACHNDLCFAYSFHIMPYLFFLAFLEIHVVWNCIQAKKKYWIKTLFRVCLSYHMKHLFL